MRKCIFILSIIFSQLYLESAFAQTEKGISFQAVIKLPSGEIPNKSGMTVNARILSPNNCILREEQFSGVNITNGYINLNLGTGSVGGQDPGLTIKAVMDNSVTIANGPSQPGGLVCLNADGSVNGSVTSFNPSVTTGARKFRMSLTIDSIPVVADFNMRSVAYSISSETLDGKMKTDFINVNGVSGLTQANAESIFNRFTKLDAILSNFNSGGTALTGNSTNVTGVVAIANGGTGASNAANAKSNLGLAAVASSGSYSDLTGQPTLGSLAAKSAVTLSTADVTGTLPIAHGGTGTTSTSQGFVFAGPTSGSGAPAFRALAATDLPASASFWSAATGGINYASGNVGIGQTAPTTKLDINGEVRLANTGSTCDGTNEGAQRYNSTSKIMEFCNGSGWVSFTAAVPVNPIATVLTYAGSSAPAGYLLCNGAAVSRTTYSALFAAIGTSYGAGDGSTTFNLPDLRGRVPVGSGTGAGLTARTLGALGGDEATGAVSITTTITVGTANAGGNSIVAGNRGLTTTAGGGPTAAAIFLDASTAPSNPEALGGVTTSQTGAGTAGNMQPYSVLNFIIKY